MCCVCVVVVVEQITGGGLPPHTTRLPHHHWHQCHSYGAGDGYNPHDLEHTFPHLKHAGFHAKTFAPQRGQPHCVALSVNGIPKARKSGRQRPPTATSGTRIPMVALRDFIWVFKTHTGRFITVCTGWKLPPSHGRFGFPRGTLPRMINQNTINKIGDKLVPGIK